MSKSREEKLNIAILGFGWLGKALSSFWHDHHKNISYHGYGRSARFGSSSFCLEEKTKELPDQIKECDVLLIMIPPGKNTGNYKVIISKIGTLLSRNKKVILISTTSVFEKNTGVCTEETQPIASSQRAKDLHEAEVHFLNLFPNGLIIRSAGQIGKERAPVKVLATKKSSNQLPNGNAPVNLIHQEDLVRICTLAIFKDLKGILHAVSPFHPLKGDYYRKQAKSLGLSLLEFPMGELVDKKIESLILKRLNYEFFNKECEL
jgi:hypothetical protein